MAISKTDGGTGLVSRIKGGDQQAEVELVECYSAVVMSIIRREVGAAALADDLYQETFCIILEKVRRGDVREAEKLSGFVCGVARNQVIRHFQRAARQRNLAGTEDADSI